MWEVEVGSRKLEIGSRKSEVGSGKSEVRSGKWEVRSGKWEVRSLTMQHWVSTVRNQKSGVRTLSSRKSEVWSMKSEVWSLKSEVGSRKTLLDFRTLLLTLQWHTGFCEETFDVNSSSNNAKYLKFNCQKVESTKNGKLRRSSGRFQTLIWRPGETLQTLESPGLSGRVESPVLWLWRRARKWKWGTVYNSTG